ncbi:MAG: methyltransferase domain-containing protein [Clostridia bacterium]|nr:methyltransferase domain-containing protein [Clostridia bacterium]
MTKPTNSDSFSVLAHVYDSLNGSADYSKLADDIEACFSRYLDKKPMLVLDLACGTGKLTSELARRGYDMIGADSSVDMLMQARDHTQGQDVLLLQQGMCDFELYGTVGAVVCTFDSLNYLIENGELEQCFALVHNYLDPDGLFLFDMNMPSKFQNYYDGRDFILESDDGSAYCGWQSTFDSQTRLCQFSLTIFELNEDGTYNRAEECQWERAYEEGEIVRALTESGFELLASSSQGFSKEDDPKAGTGRRYFAARCKKPGVVSPA